MPGQVPVSTTPTVFVVDDDLAVLGILGDILREHGLSVEGYSSSEAFLAAYRPGRRGCLVVDGLMPGTSGIELLEQLRQEDRDLPAIVITGHGDIAMAVKAMKAGAIDFLEKPARPDEIVASVNRALGQADESAEHRNRQMLAATRIAALTFRERQVMDFVVDGLPNKEIAALLNISQRTVENHRAALMKRTGAGSLPDLIRLVMQAALPSENAIPITEAVTPE